MSGPIERIIVPFDAASENRTAIDAAARLAERAKAALHGVFVEDEDLLRLAGLPFARQITLAAGAERLTIEEVLLQLRAAAERARQELIAAAERLALAWSFEIVRGPLQQALSGGTERDLVVAGALTRPVGGHFRVESRWIGSVEAALGPFLLVRHPWNAAGAVVILMPDRGPGSQRLLEAAAHIAAARGGLLTVVSPPALAGVAGFDKWVADQLAAFAVHLEIEVVAAEPAMLHQRIGELGCRLLAIEAGVGEGAAGRLRDFAERFACDVLIVR